MMRNLGGAVGIAVSGAILNDRTNFHFQAIASNLTPANGAMMRLIDGVAQRYGAVLGSAQEGHAAALKQLWRLAYREASTLAYADAFRAIMIAFIVATLLVPFMRNVAAPKGPRAGFALNRTPSRSAMAASRVRRDKAALPARGFACHPVAEIRPARRRAVYSGGWGMTE